MRGVPLGLESRGVREVALRARRCGHQELVASGRVLQLLIAAGAVGRRKAQTTPRGIPLPRRRLLRRLAALVPRRRNLLAVLALRGASRALRLHEAGRAKVQGQRLRICVSLRAALAPLPQQGIAAHGVRLQGLEVLPLRGTPGCAPRRPLQHLLRDCLPRILGSRRLACQVSRGRRGCLLQQRRAGRHARRLRNRECIMPPCPRPMVQEGKRCIQRRGLALVGPPSGCPRLRLLAATLPPRLQARRTRAALDCQREPARRANLQATTQAPADRRAAESRPSLSGPRPAGRPPRPLHARHLRGHARGAARESPNQLHFTAAIPGPSPSP
mmetsp:Transcript_44058/g.137172  ORF Transcript_44058/g.137172 Transcript_44058/m.137172 type:complete len:329 (+) Transcript_44058:202-1188(+)